LGDLLFQIIFLAEMGKEAGQFSLVDVMAGISEKMIRRHPHIFGEKKEISVAEVKKNWQQIKKIERGTNKTDNDLFGNIPRSLPALKRAQKITKEASQYGFDWQSADEVLDKLKEELAEFIEARKNNDQNKIAAELGDLFFTLVNLSRFTEVDAEMSLTRSTNKFLQRFSYIIARLEACGKSLDEATLADMDALWNEAKKLEDIKK
jgi:tetrapyrrole methylase family protein/MazG family protein